MARLRAIRKLGRNYNTPRFRIEPLRLNARLSSCHPRLRIGRPFNLRPNLLRAIELLRSSVGQSGHRQRWAGFKQVLHF